VRWTWYLRDCFATAASGVRNCALKVLVFGEIVAGEDGGGDEVAAGVSMGEDVVL
jgi:hypothetical protein